MLRGPWPAENEWLTCKVMIGRRLVGFLPKKVLLLALLSSIAKVSFDELLGEPGRPYEAGNQYKLGRYVW